MAPLDCSTSCGTGRPRLRSALAKPQALVPSPQPLGTHQRLSVSTDVIALGTWQARNDTALLLLRLAP